MSLLSRPQGQTIGASLLEFHRNSYISMPQFEATVSITTTTTSTVWVSFFVRNFYCPAKSEEIRMKLDLLHRIDFICFDLFPKIRKLDTKPKTQQPHSSPHTHTLIHLYKHNGSIAIAEMNTFWSNCRDSSIVVFVLVVGLRDRGGR